MIVFDFLHDTDLRRAYTTAPSWGAADILANRSAVFVHVEANLAIVDADRVIYAEPDFPVVELATAFVDWMRVPAQRRDRFEFDSVSGFAENPGAVRILGSGGQWRLGSVFEPDSWTRQIGARQLDAHLESFVTQVIDAGRTDLGLDLAPLVRGS